MKIIVLTGMPASGKSTLAKKLSEKFNMPILEKDALKEELFDTLGFECYAEKRKLDIAANAVLLKSVESLLEQNVPMIIDNNFDTASQERFVEILNKYNCTAITLFLGGNTDAFYKRYVERDNAHARHLGHVLQEHYPPHEGDSLDYTMTREEFSEKFEKRGMNQFSAPGYRIDIDATEPALIDVDALIQKVEVLFTCQSDIPPFQMHENIYFVGARKVSVHIIKTEVGLVMIDTGYPDMGDQIKESIRLMGLDFKDLVAIFHSHGHYDHYGCTVQFKEETGAKTYISSIDNEIVNGTYKHLSCEREPLPNFDCDVLIEDGDVFTFGTTKIRCVMTPGHSPGVVSFFIETGSGNDRIVAAMHGGVGMNAFKASWLNRVNLSFTWRDIFRENLHKVYKEQVDLVLGNHPSQNDTKGKLQKVLNGESILDTSEWKAFLIEIEKKLDALIEEEKAL